MKDTTSPYNMMLSRHRNKAGAGCGHERRIKAGVGRGFGLSSQSVTKWTSETQKFVNIGSQQLYETVKIGSQQLYESLLIPLHLRVHECHTSYPNEHNSGPLLSSLR